MFHVLALKNVIYLHDKPSNAHLQTYVQPHVVTLQQHVSATSLTMSYNTNTINIQ